MLTAHPPLLSSDSPVTISQRQSLALVWIPSSGPETLCPVQGRGGTEASGNLKLGAQEEPRLALTSLQQTLLPLREQHRFFLFDG